MGRIVLDCILGTCRFLIFCYAFYYTGTFLITVNNAIIVSIKNIYGKDYECLNY